MTSSRWCLYFGIPALKRYRFHFSCLFRYKFFVVHFSFLHHSSLSARTNQDIPVSHHWSKWLAWNFKWIPPVDLCQYDGINSISDIIVFCTCGTPHMNNSNSCIPILGASTSTSQISSVLLWVIDSKESMTKGNSGTWVINFGGRLYLVKYPLYHYNWVLAEASRKS